jgi:hypothetical protein
MIIPRQGRIPSQYKYSGISRNHCKTAVIGSITPKSPNLSEANPDTLPFMGYVSNTMKTP